MIGVVIRKKGVAIKKMSFFGNDEESLKIVDRDKLANPELEYGIYTDPISFDQVVVEPEVSEEEKEWEKIKSKATEVELFLAKKLGFK